MKNRSKIKYFSFVLFFIIIFVSSFKKNQKYPKNIDNALFDEEFNKEIYLKRHLLQVNNEINISNQQEQAKYQNCVRPDIEQFPKTLFSQKQRTQGAFLVHLFVAIYMFIGLAIVCDEYFVPSLETICKIFNLKEDIAGATFMAAGSSAPELATTVISLFIAKDVDIGIGTVVGSAVFNIMFVVSIVSLLSGMIICISWYPIMRDSFFYLISILAMILVIMDEKVYWYEALILLSLYGFYITALIFNSKLQSWIYSKASFMTKTGLINESQLETNIYNTLKHAQTTELSNFNSSSTINIAETMDVQSQRDEQEKQFDPNDSIENFSPFKFPSKEQSLTEKLRFVIFWPLLAILYITVPDCRRTFWQKYFILTFIMSLVWLSIFSYLMVWMITVIGYTLRIPDTIMGITLIAFGASVPDALSSLLVAKNGQGDMAISNAIGSNVFDILICLGIPWLVRSLTMSESFIVVKSKGLTYSAITLFGTVLILIAALRINKWQLDKKLGIFLMIVYLLFILLASLYEMNILGANHLPMCLDSEW